MRIIVITICFLLHSNMSAYTYPFAFVCNSNNELIRIKSSSGGIFFILVKKVSDLGGVVWGQQLM